MWQVVDRIGAGTFSEIFEGVNVETGVPVALKVDRKASAALPWESDLLLRLQRYPLVPRHYGLQ